MQIEDLENVTASTGTGPVGQKTWHNIVRGNKGKFGTELLIDVTELEAAIKAGAHKFMNKAGHTILTVKPKLWPPKEATETSQPDAPQDELDEALRF